MHDSTTDSDSRLIIGMPAGSLANPQRGGNLVRVLEEAGFKTSGYESGGPTSFPGMGFLYGWDGRPQEFGSQLGIDELDVAIAGDDWIRERILELDIEYGVETELTRVLSLRRGGVRIVGILDPSAYSGLTGDDDDWRSVFSSLAEADKQILTVVSEMPYLALDWVRRRMKEIGNPGRFPDYSVQKYKTPPKIDRGIVIYETWGKTEAKVKNGGADLGIEITQSGSSIRNYGLRIIDTLMESETGIWIHPRVREDSGKRALLEMLLVNLYGTINAENKVLVVFNVPNDRCGNVEEYLKENNLFGDEPTINRGASFTEYSIQLDVTNRENPIARVRYSLARLGSKNIDTIPLTSSIPSIDCIDL
jgi:ATP phosphoribosyltransferase